MNQEQAGLVIPPQDVGAMVAAIEKLADDAGLMEEYRRCALAAAPRYDRKALAGDMLGCLVGVVRGAGGAKGP